MSLDIHGTVTSMVAHQHLAAGNVRSDDAATGRPTKVRAAAKHEQGDTVDVANASGAATKSAAIPNSEHALQTSRLVATQITANAAQWVHSQANSSAERVFALVV